MDKNKLIENISVVAAGGSLIGARFFTVKPVAILEETNFFIVSISIGVILSAIWILYFFRIKPNYFIKEQKRIASLFCQAVAIIIVTIFLIGVYNYETGKKNTFHEKSIILGEWYYPRTHAGWFRMKIMNKIEKVDVRTSIYNSFKIGDTIDLTIGKGGTGYFIIYKFGKL